MVCGYAFGYKRRKSNAKEKVLWNQYVRGKQTYNELAFIFAISRRTIQRKLDKVRIKRPLYKASDSIVITDTTYFGKKLGLMVFRDYYTKRNIYWQYVKHENLMAYIEGIDVIKTMGWNIVGIVCDGKRGMFNAFGNIPVQMCQFHQVAIVRRYITNNPRLPAGIELKQITQLLTETDKESFEGLISDWYNKWKDFISERSTNPQSGKKHYTHKRIRSAYRSLKYNLPYLFTWYDNIELNMPNTTNSLEGVFSNLKNKLNLHNGLKLFRKMKFIDDFLA